METPVHIVLDRFATLTMIVLLAPLWLCVGGVVYGIGLLRGQYRSPLPLCARLLRLALNPPS
jgi:hypothetical protein